MAAKPRNTKVRSLPRKIEEKPTYTLLNQQHQHQLLQQRLGNLEAEHFETGLLAEEAEVVGADNAPQYREHQQQIEARMKFVRSRIEAMGPVPVPEADSEE